MSGTDWYLGEARRLSITFAEELADGRVITSVDLGNNPDLTNAEIIGFNTTVAGIVTPPGQGVLVTYSPSQSGLRPVDVLVQVDDGSKLNWHHVFLVSERGKV